MKINQFWCAISGHRESKLPYKYGSDGYIKLLKVIEEQVVDLMHEGATNWVCGMQTGCDNEVAKIVLEQRDIIGTTAYLYCILPFKDMSKSYNERQKLVFNYLVKNAKDTYCLNETYVDGCYRKRNEMMIKRSDFLLAVRLNKAKNSGTQMTISFAIKKGIEVRIIDPETYEVKIINAKVPLKIFID